MLKRPIILYDTDPSGELVTGGGGVDAGDLFINLDGTLIDDSSSSVSFNDSSVLESPFDTEGMEFPTQTTDQRIDASLDSFFDFEGEPVISREGLTFESFFKDPTINSTIALNEDTKDMMDALGGEESFLERIPILGKLLSNAKGFLSQSEREQGEEAFRKHKEFYEGAGFSPEEAAVKAKAAAGAEWMAGTKGSGLDPRTWDGKTWLGAAMLLASFWQNRETRKFVKSETKRREDREDEIIKDEREFQLAKMDKANEPAGPAVDLSSNNVFAA